MIAEAYWDDVYSRPPATWRLLLGLLISTPLMLLYTLTRPPRWAGGLLRRWQAFGIWLLRLAYSLVLVLIVEIVIVTGVFIALVAHRTGLSRRLTRAIAMSIGDVYAFSVDQATSARMIGRVVDEAEELATRSDRLVVLAHSQGGAIALEAIRHERWPGIATSVITLGSGHKRLAVIRRLTATALRKFALAVGSAMAVLLGVWAGGGLGDPSLVDDAEAFWGRLGRLAGVGMLVGLVVLVLVRSTGRSIGERIRASAAEWLDIWATHDVVPDGPVFRSGVRSLQVHNGRSIFSDHTTYHLNAPEVIATVVDQIDPARLAGDRDLVLELQVRRRHRLRPRPVLTILYLGWLPWLRRRLRGSAVVEAEFAGQLD